VTPKKIELVTWLTQYWPRSGDATDALLGRFAAREKSVTKWMRWFGRFWYISFGKLPIRGDATPEMQGVKVRILGRFWLPKVVPKLEPFLVLKNGTVFGHQKWDLANQNTTGGHLIRVPFWFTFWVPCIQLLGLRQFKKVASFMRWSQWLLNGPLAGKEVVFVNIDETPIYKELQPRRGSVVTQWVFGGVTGGKPWVGSVSFLTDNQYTWCGVVCCMVAELTWQAVVLQAVAYQAIF
jgi:hypothetical protein